MKKEIIRAIYDPIGKSLNYYILKRHYFEDKEGDFADKNVKGVARILGTTEKQVREDITFAEDIKEEMKEEIKEIEVLFNELTKKLDAGS